MTTFIKKIKRIKVFTGMVLVLFVSLALISCDYEYELPEVGSIADLTPPTSSFSYTPGSTPEDYFIVQFSNTSVSSTDYIWDFGDGSPTSTDAEPIHIYPEGEQSYTVTLKSSDKLEVSSIFENDIALVIPEITGPVIPEILEPGFDKGNDSRDPWRNGDLGGVIQITSSSAFNGGYAAKFPNSNDRIAYQELEVTPNSEYILTYDYSLDAAAPGNSVTVSILATPTTLTDPAEVAGAVIASHVGDLSTEKKDLVRVNLAFNTGANSKVAIYVNNAGDKTGYVDDFSIAAKE